VDVDSGAWMQQWLHRGWDVASSKSPEEIQSPKGKNEESSCQTFSEY